MQQERAETVGLQVLAWLAENDELLPVFLGASGVSLAGVKDGMNDPGFLAAVLDFLTQDDDWVIGFCDSAGLPYDVPMAARAALPGGQQMHWT
ncbi:DUF3572 domain-containing protein [Oceaniglobus indicus]|uniref:DUF3572 domain-containing protein n=1 Tax=Oceaniglobus indicus TaxID=2047749 RepID=UPI000C1A71ED|nr:DUF3572 domain-containing protein [Oceaniglobus indicus]